MFLEIYGSFATWAWGLIPTLATTFIIFALLGGIIWLIGDGIVMATYKFVQTGKYWGSSEYGIVEPLDYFRGDSLRYNSINMAGPRSLIAVFITGLLMWGGLFVLCIISLIWPILLVALFFVTVAWLLRWHKLSKERRQFPKQTKKHSIDDLIKELGDKQ